MSLFTQDVFRMILDRKPDAEWGAARYARNADKLGARIDQLNRMWDMIPQDFKKMLRPRLLSTADRSFKGAVAELIAYTVLRSWFTEIQCDPRIGIFTPDFCVRSAKDRRAFISEVFSLGPHEAHKRYQWSVNRLRKALRGFQSPYHLSFKIGGLFGTSLEWIAEDLKSYLTNYCEDGDSEKVHRLEKDGQYVFFNIGPKSENGSGAIGYRSQVMSGAPQIKNLTGRLEDKVQKYKFPFLAVCVTDSLGTVDRYTLMEAMVGRLHMSVPIDIEEGQMNAKDAGWAYDTNGFWGIDNPKIAEHLGVQ